MARFKELFYGKYFPADVRGRVTREFMSLWQGNLSVAEFIRKFDRGCHFVPMIAGGAAQKLREDIYRRLANHALLDSGAAHSFISKSFVKRLGILPVAMDLGFRVSIPSGDQMFTFRIVRGLELKLQQKAMLEDLIVLQLPELPCGKPFVFEAARHQQMPHLISCMCARKLIKRRCQAFLASIVSVTEPTSQRLEDVDVVCEFSSPYLDQFVMIFFDDILIYLKNREEHSQQLRTVLYTLQDRRLYAKFSKCEFWLDRVKFLGHIVSQDGIEVDHSKVEAVKDWPVPKSVIEIRSFLGLASYYRKFIQGFPSIAVPPL
ncbi:uncharacterized protein [Primulina huaijiensis]|uniref:uncharacterized protein n=1 Tax=Primulina huaijiensis TaxID=1492673 RepID=UPI003CC79684